MLLEVCIIEQQTPYGIKAYKAKCYHQGTFDPPPGSQVLYLEVIIEDCYLRNSEKNFVEHMEQLIVNYVNNQLVKRGSSLQPITVDELRTLGEDAKCHVKWYFDVVSTSILVLKPVVFSPGYERYLEKNCPVIDDQFNSEKSTTNKATDEAANEVCEDKSPYLFYETAEQAAAHQAASVKKNCLARSQPRRVSEKNLLLKVKVSMRY